MARPADGSVLLLDPPPPAGSDRPGDGGSEVEVIPGVRGSVLHQTCVEIYRRHRPDAAGRCVACGGPDPCAVRTFAAWVIATAGEDARRYEPTAPPLTAPSDVDGYALGGAGRPCAEYHTWER